MFNWFRRQFSDRSQEEQEEQTPSQVPSEESPDAEEAEQPEAATVEVDYLNWAKAAYQNIQQRQGQSATPDPGTPTEESETTVAPESASEVAEMPPVAEEVPQPPPPHPAVVTEEDPQTPPTAVEPQPLAVTEEETTAVAEIETAPEIAVEAPETLQSPLESPVPPEPTPEATETETETVLEPDRPETDTQAAIPAWMQKSEGLERLKETAIETPEPEPVSPEGEMGFDEDFIWSAQVLAAQGRRPDDISEEEITWLKRLRQGLGKTRRGLINQLKAIVGQGPLNQDAVMEIEALLLQADVGVEATDYIIETLQAKLRQEALPPEEAIAYLKQILRDLLEQPLAEAEETAFVPEKDVLNVWLITGVNGAGKTTTIGKLAHLAQKSGYSCMIAAADTFRAAAVQQVKVWGDRSNTPVVANPGQNTDPAAVVYDAINAAHSRNTELLLVDTAGRLQNKKNLMEELAKIRRIIDKKAPNAKVESLLVLDATLGQNGLRQAQVFSEAAKLSGVVLTKLDGSAKGGVALAVAQQLNLPIRFIGAGEGIEDLRPFSSYEFVEALLNG